MTRWKLMNPEMARAKADRENRARSEKYWADQVLRERDKANARERYHRKRAAGYTEHHVAPVEVFNELMRRQDGKCAICGREETAKDPSGRTKRLAVDHDRITGAVRGLLCARCNTAIGLLQHDPSRAQAAVDYLVRNGLRLVS